MRILVVAACPLPWPRGTPIRIHRLAEALVHRGHEVHVATYPLGDQGTPTPYILHRVGRQTSTMDARPGPSLKKLLVLDPMLVRKVRKLLDEIEFDVIHAHHYEGLITALIARRTRHNVPIVYDAHTLLATELPYYDLPIPPKLAERIGLWLDAGLPRRADHIVAVTAGMREWLTREGAASDARVSLVQNGVEHEHFSVPASQDRGARRRRVVYSGNLAEYQGVDLLLGAFARVRAEAPDAQLVLVTDSSPSWLGQKLEALEIAASVSIVQVDFEHLPDALVEADVLVNPRPYCDGLPQKLLNYMATGRPIVSFAGSADLLEHENTALLVLDGDIEGLAHAILRVLNDPDLAARLGANAREEVVATRGWRQVADRVERVYCKVTSERPHLVARPRA
ncbi:MAG: glycosyltransferase family 4 protein [Steroidobacteraceae bacterium]|nr:glycosyltransferase family 4 protein [Steroidobacteraceae bacterium]